MADHADLRGRLFVAASPCTNVMSSVDFALVHHTGATFRAARCVRMRTHMVQSRAGLRVQAHVPCSEPFVAFAPPCSSSCASRNSLYIDLSSRLCTRRAACRSLSTVICSISDTHSLYSFSL